MKTNVWESHFCLSKNCENIVVAKSSLCWHRNFYFFFKYQVQCPQLECMISVTFQKVSLFLGGTFLQCKEPEVKIGVRTRPVE